MDELENPTNKLTINAKDRVSRRDFVTLIWQSLLWLSGILGLAGLWRYFSFRPYPSKPTIFDLGPVDDLPKNAMINISEANAAVLTTQNSFTAISLECPHLGCIVELLEDNFICPCHNSRFTMQGDLLKGSADQPLRKLKLEITEDGHLLMDIS